MKIYVHELLFSVSFALDCVERDLLGAATNHSKRVACLCLDTGARLGMDRQALFDLACCAVLHDNALTEYILSERRGGAGMERIRQEPYLRAHCVMGAKNAEGFPLHKSGREAILYHHENADGSGCFGIGDGEIPDAAAIIRIADNTDVLFRLGRDSREKRETVRRHVREQAGRLYIPRIADAFLDAYLSQPEGSLRDGGIQGLLQEKAPYAAVECSNSQIAQIANVFAKIIDYKSPFTMRHSIGIAEKSKAMAGFYGFGGDKTALFYLAAALHDVGKLAVPTEILEKPGSLTPQEYREIQLHAQFTYDMLSPVTGLETVTRWAASHHEKLDGTGYPFGKRGEEMDFQERLLACLDIYQALREDRPYRPGMGHSKAMKVLGSLSGKHLDGRIAADLGDAFSQAEAEPEEAFSLV